MAKLSTLADLLDSLPGYGERSAIVALQKEVADVWSFRKLNDHIARLASGLLRTGVHYG